MSHSYLTAVSPAHLTYGFHTDKFGTHSGNSFSHKQCSKYINLTKGQIEQYCILLIFKLSKQSTKLYMRAFFPLTFNS